MRRFPPLLPALFLVASSSLATQLWFLTTTTTGSSCSSSSSPSSSSFRHSFHRHPSFVRSPPAPPNSIYVLGERNSGTKYAANRVLGNAFHDNAMSSFVDPSRSHEVFSANIPVLKHKHMFRHSLLTAEEVSEIEQLTEVLWIFVVRGPCDWAEAMKREPWHMCDPANTTGDCPGEQFVGLNHRQTLRTNYTLAQFWRLPWGDWPESSNFRNLSFVGPDFAYEHVFALRAHKLRIMAQVWNAAPRNVKLSRLGELERAPDMLVQNIVAEYNLTLKSDYWPQIPNPNKVHRERCLSHEEWEIAQTSIDWNLESMFGYGPQDCHQCYEGGKVGSGKTGVRDGE